MQEAILQMHYPNGTLPVKGYRCPACGNERLLADSAQEAHDTAERIGLLGLESAQTRKLLKTGNSLAVSLDPAWVKEVLLDAKPGTPVRVGRQGNRIVIRL